MKGVVKVKGIYNLNIRNGTGKLKKMKIHFQRMMKRMLKVMFQFLFDYLGSHPPTGQTMLDRMTETSVIPPREHNLDLLPVRHHDGFDQHNLHSMASEISQ